MHEPLKPSSGNSLRRGASRIAAKFLSTPPLLTLPAIGLAAWFATPYAVRLSQPRSADPTGMADTSGAGGTTTIPRSDPPATPASTPSADTPAVPATVATILTQPVTAAMVPSWLPLTVPVPAAPKPAPQPAPSSPTVQRPVPPAPTPRPKMAERIVEQPSRQQSTERQPQRQALDRPRQAARMPTGADNSRPTGRGPFNGGATQQWHTGGPVARGPFGFQRPFGGYRGPVTVRPAVGFGNVIRRGGGFFGRRF